MDLVSIGVALAASYGVYRITESLAEKPSLYYVKTPRNEQIIQKCTALSDPNIKFKPTFWLPTGHLQTIGGAMLRDNPKDIEYRRYDLMKKCFICLDCL